MRVTSTDAVAEGRRVAAGHVVFKLAFDVAQKAGCTKTKEIGFKPIIAALFISLWDIYGKAFKEYLYPVDIEEIEEELESIIEGTDEETKKE